METWWVLSDHISLLLVINFTKIHEVGKKKIPLAQHVTLYWSNEKVKLFLLFPASTVFHCTKLFSITSLLTVYVIYNHMLIILHIYFYLNWRNAKHHLTHSNTSLPTGTQEVHKCSSLKVTLFQTSQDSFVCLRAALTEPHHMITLQSSFRAEHSSPLFQQNYCSLVCPPPFTSKLLDIYFQVCISQPL